MKYSKIIMLIMALTMGLCTTAIAVQLDGLMTVEPKLVEKVEVPILDPDGNPYIDPETGEQLIIIVDKFIKGSYFSMGSDNPMMGVSLEGGILLGTFQNFVLDPDEPHPPSGTGYAFSGPTALSDALATFSFFGVNTYIGLNPLSYQSGNEKPVPSAWVDAEGNLTVELSCWEVSWGTSVFEQGPRPDNTGPFITAKGTYDYATGRYVLGWKSQIKGGPFNGVPGFWHLEGEILPDPLDATSLAQPETVNVRSQGGDFMVTIAVEDVDGSLVPAANVMEGVSIISVGAVAIDAGEISETVADRTVNALGEVVAAFNDPATGNRQDVIAAVMNVQDKTFVDVCVSGRAIDVDGIKRPFESCSSIKINNKGSR